LFLTASSCQRLLLTLVKTERTLPADAGRLTGGIVVVQVDVLISETLRRRVRSVVHVSDGQFGEGHAQRRVFAPVGGVKVTVPLGERLAVPVNRRRGRLDHVPHLEERCLQTAQQFATGIQPIVKSKPNQQKKLSSRVLVTDDGSTDSCHKLQK
jgi:hypothetical protein